MTIYNSILDTIGRTPIVRINRLAPPHVSMYVKVEYFNPGGSVKDRLAIGIIEDDLRTILFPRLSDRAASMLSSGDTNEKIILLSYDTGDVVYRLDARTPALLGIDMVENGKLKTQITFRSVHHDTVQRISIRHYDYPLAIQLEELVNE